MIDGYVSRPGEHCGSVAMRGLLRHYCDLDLPEAAVFGLGAGAASVYLKGPGLDPSALFFGRTASMERDLASHLQVDYREQPEPDDDEAWRVVREEVLAGRPTMLSGDILYLDYREFKVHFPGHRFVLLGFDDEIEKAFIADRIRPEAEACSYSALRTSRNPPEGMSTHNLWGRFEDVHVGRSLEEATRVAIDRCARSMLGRVDAETGGEDAFSSMAQSGIETAIGLEAVRALARDVTSWPDRDDAKWIASYTASCIEKFGNGGGNFRRLYAGFLDWANAIDPKLVPDAAPKLAVEAADAWTAVSDSLFAASREEADPKHWQDAQQHALRVAQLEERLFTMLADQVA